ncbi:MAG: CDGSH iron-sulfur domain-containing protein [Proteobacteria bacterium]|nr:CDGSH iron-sulfur domain-containing protein [Pseudomonadota bacterium]
MKLTIIANGPIVLDTDESVSVSVDGETQTQKGPLFLCRCGQSSTKPFCDSTHRKVGFEAGAAEFAGD